MEEQKYGPIAVMQGGRGVAAENRWLDHCGVGVLAPWRGGVPKIEVGVGSDADGIATRRATDMATKKSKDVRIVAGSGLSQSDVDRLVAEAVESKQDDVRRRELAELRSNAEALLFTSENALKEYPSPIHI